MFINNFDLFLFRQVYSVPLRQSFESLQAVRDEILRVKDVANVPMVVVGNKIDLNARREVTLEEVSYLFQPGGSMAHSQGVI